MRPDWVDHMEFPLRIQLRPTPASMTDTFAWLHGKIFKLEADYREVFQTTSNADGEHFVYFSEAYRTLAVHFAVKWGI